MRCLNGRAQCCLEAWAPNLAFKRLMWELQGQAVSCNDGLPTQRAEVHQLVSPWGSVLVSPAASSNRTQSAQPRFAASIRAVLPSESCWSTRWGAQHSSSASQAASPLAAALCRSVVGMPAQLLCRQHRGRKTMRLVETNPHGLQRCGRPPAARPRSAAVARPVGGACSLHRETGCHQPAHLGSWGRLRCA